jgi:hypothetical protein
MLYEQLISLLQAGSFLAVRRAATSFWAANTSLLARPACHWPCRARHRTDGMRRVFFLHIASGPESTNNILALALDVQKNVSVLLAEVTGVDLNPLSCVHSIPRSGDR